jgi:hypothetical protein
VSIVGEQASGLADAATLARAGMAPAVAADPSQLWMDTSGDLMIDDRFALAMRDPAHQWAVAAALAAVVAARVPSAPGLHAWPAAPATSTSPVIAERDRVSTDGDDHGFDGGEWGVLATRGTGWPR